MLDCVDSPPISDEHVVVACALLRLHHPILASQVVDTDSVPHYVYTSPLTEVHALRQTEAQIKFETFEDRDAAAVLLRDRWGGLDPRDALDMRTEVCTIHWSRHASGLRSQYVLGIHATHFTSDARGFFIVIRQFLERLAAPARAQAELAQELPNIVSSIELPGPIESFLPYLTACSVDEQTKCRNAYSVLMTSSSLAGSICDYFRLVSDIAGQQSQSGLVPDGSLKEDVVDTGTLHHVWSEAETVIILRTCKAHSVSTAQLASVTMAVSSILNDYGYPAERGAIPNSVPRRNLQIYSVIHLPSSGKIRIAPDATATTTKSVALYSAIDWGCSKSSYIVTCIFPDGPKHIRAARMRTALPSRYSRIRHMYLFHRWR
ncbi:hypothetical protein AcV7_002211 [Taiwanofungus camphoratus]|nr:hypothetical protein AcV7_002211 [Antrodia cinnamomea]